MEKLTVDFVQDVACPWCRIGQANLLQAIEQWDGPPVELHYHPFLLNPGLPPEGADFRPYLENKFGVSDLTPMFERVSAASRQAGLLCDWDNVTKAPSTINAHRLIAMTPPEHKSALVTDLFDSYFEHGQDIGDLSVLAAIAARHGWNQNESLRRLRSDELMAETQLAVAAAAEGGVTGVPFFLFNGSVAISGAQSPETMLAAMQQAVNEPAVTA